MEVGNSGMFRPEMLRPMGLPEDVSVIAWGLSLERWACFFPSVAHLSALLSTLLSCCCIRVCVASAISSEQSVLCIFVRPFAAACLEIVQHMYAYA